MRWRSISISPARWPARLLHGDDGGLRSGGRSGDPRHGAGRIFRTRQGVRRTVSALARRRANCRSPPIRSCWRKLASATIHTIAIRARARRAAQGTGSDRQGRDQCDVWGGGLIPPRGIDDIFQRPAGLETFDLARDIFRDLVGIGVGGVVRRQHDLRMGPERAVGWQRLLAKTSSDAAPSVPSSRHARMSASFCKAAAAGIDQDRRAHRTVRG